jgi:hypothetical protein
MSELRCVLCNQPAGNDYKVFSMTPEARALYEQQFPGGDPAPLMAKNVLCARCHALPMSARKALARDAVKRELESLRRGRKS